MMVILYPSLKRAMVRSRDQATLFVDMNRKEQKSWLRTQFQPFGSLCVMRVLIDRYHVISGITLLAIMAAPLGARNE